MKHYTTPFALIASLLIGCLLPAATVAGENQGHHQSGIVGRVQLEQISFRFAWKVRVSKENFDPVAVLETDEAGHFAVNLKPGIYRLTPFVGGDGGASLVGPSLLVAVEKKNFTVVELPLVFGPYWPYWPPIYVGDGVWVGPM
jgi:hypothetical protein